MANTKFFNETAEQAKVRRTQQKQARMEKERAALRKSSRAASAPVKQPDPDPDSNDNNAKSKLPKRARYSDPLSNRDMNRQDSGERENLVYHHSDSEHEVQPDITNKKSKTTRAAPSRSKSTSSSKASSRTTCSESSIARPTPSILNHPPKKARQLRTKNNLPAKSKAIKSSSSSQDASASEEEMTYSKEVGLSNKGQSQQQFLDEDDPDATEDQIDESDEEVVPAKKTRAKKGAAPSAPRIKKTRHIELDEKVYFPGFMPITGEQVTMLLREGIFINNTRMSKFVPNRHVAKINVLSPKVRPGIMKTILRNHFHMYQYEITHNGKKQFVRWDCYSGLVHLRWMFELFHPGKSVPENILNSTPNIAPLLQSPTGGDLRTQGYWLPLVAARELATKFCWPIKEKLVLIFGYDFPDDCIPPTDDRYNTEFRISDETMAIAHAMAAQLQIRWDEYCVGDLAAMKQGDSTTVLNSTSQELPYAAFSELPHKVWSEGYYEKQVPVSNIYTFPETKSDKKQSKYDEEKRKWGNKLVNIRTGSFFTEFIWFGYNTYKDFIKNMAGILLPRKKRTEIVQDDIECGNDEDEGVIESEVDIDNETTEEITDMEDDEVVQVTSDTEDEELEQNSDEPEDEVMTDDDFAAPDLTISQTATSDCDATDGEEYVITARDIYPTAPVRKRKRGVSEPAREKDVDTTERPRKRHASEHLIAIPTPIEDAFKTTSPTQHTKKTSLTTSKTRGLLKITEFIHKVRSGRIKKLSPKTHKTAIWDEHREGRRINHKRENGIKVYAKMPEPSGILVEVSLNPPTSSREQNIIAKVLKAHTELQDSVVGYIYPERALQHVKERQEQEGEESDKAQDLEESYDHEDIFIPVDLKELPPPPPPIDYSAITTVSAYGPILKGEADKQFYFLIACEKIEKAPDNSMYPIADVKGPDLKVMDTPNEVTNVPSWFTHNEIMQYKHHKYYESVSNLDLLAAANLIYMIRKFHVPGISDHWVRI